MVEQIKLLRKLQELDLKILELENEREGCTVARDQLVESLKEIEERLARNRALLEEREVRRRKAEGDLAVEKTNLKKWKARLNDSKNSRESVALVREIDLQEKSNRQMEEELLKVMIEVDEFKKLIAADEAEQADLKKRFEAEDAEAARIINEVNGKQAVFLKDRAGYTKAISPENMGRYDFIRKRRVGIALTPVKKNLICTGCHMAISPHLYTILLTGTALESCPSCSRIIYAEERVYGDAEAPAEPGAAS